VVVSDEHADAGPGDGPGDDIGREMGAAADALDRYERREQRSAPRVSQGRAVPGERAKARQVAVEETEAVSVGVTGEEREGAVFFRPVVLQSD
jgi:hypothetical protein